MKIVIATKIPSPYQVELFDYLAKIPEIFLRVIYLRRSDPDRHWSDQTLQHDAIFIDGSNAGDAAYAIDNADIAIFSWYRDRRFVALMQRRAALGRPWCFWGERPGFAWRGIPGTLMRKWALRGLRRDRRVPIWGIGRWAIDRYALEFGANRPYFNVPYVSDLSGFLSTSASRNRDSGCVVLFSGSLIERKGILELCEAFVEVSNGKPEMRLKILGAGHLEGAIRKMQIPQIEMLGFMDWEKRVRVYGQADFLCAPSRHDGWGLIVLEGLAAGLPVIASSRVGSAIDAIGTGKNGWITKPGSVASIAGALREAIALSPMDLRRMRAQCQADAQLFDLPAGARRFLDAAEKTIAGWH